MVPRFFYSRRPLLENPTTGVWIRGRKDPAGIRPEKLSGNEAGGGIFFRGNGGRTIVKHKKNRLRYAIERPLLYSFIRFFQHALRASLKRENFPRGGRPYP